MTEKTVHEIREEHGRRASKILADYHNALDRVREERALPQGAYLDRLTDAQRFGILQERKREAAEEAHRRARAGYEAEVERYQGELSDRAKMLEAELFGTEGPDGATALARAALASEEELGTMLDLAVRAKNPELARAVFVAAEGRGFSGLVVRYFEEAKPEARGLYREWRGLPPVEVLERQQEGVGCVVAPPDPDRLMGAPRVNA